MTKYRNTLERSRTTPDPLTPPPQHKFSLGLPSVDISSPPGPPPLKDQVMNELRDVTIQSISCPDPTESAATKIRVFQGEPRNLMENTALGIISAASGAEPSLFCLNYYLLSPVVIRLLWISQPHSQMLLLRYQLNEVEGVLLSKTKTPNLQNNSWEQNHRKETLLKPHQRKLLFINLTDLLELLGSLRLSCRCLLPLSLFKLSLVLQVVGDKIRWISELLL